MRITNTIWAAVGRRPQNEAAVPFQEILPLKLKNSVSGKSDSQKEVACLQEMSVLFACLKTNDFVEATCAKEMGTFKKCYKVHIDKELAMKKSKLKNVANPGKDLTYKQLNKFMKLYPNPK